MPGESDLNILLKTMSPSLNEGEYVFCQVEDASSLQLTDILGLFKETEGVTAILLRSVADRLKLPYTFICSWISLTIHSSLEAVGLTAAFSNALASQGISCNVVAGYFHDHIFVNTADADKAMKVLKDL